MCPKAAAVHWLPAVLNVMVTWGSPGWLEKLEPSAKFTRNGTEVRPARSVMSLRARLVIGVGGCTAEKRQILAKERGRCHTRRAGYSSAILSSKKLTGDGAFMKRRCTSGETRLYAMTRPSLNSISRTWLFGS